MDLERMEKMHMTTKIELVNGCVNGCMNECVRERWPVNYYGKMYFPG